MPAAHTDIKDLAKAAWIALRPRERSANGIIAALKHQGVSPLPSKGSVNRWKKEWESSVKDTAEVLLPSLKTVGDPPPKALADIPQALQDALSPRLLYVAQGEGLEKVENAVVKLADAIASKAPEIAEMLLDTETETETVTTGGDAGGETTKTVEKAKVARSAVTALTQLAAAMQTITAARSMVSLAHRNYSEGDLFGAQAQAVLESGRAERAKEINGKHKPSGGLSAEDEARAALEGTATDE